MLRTGKGEFIENECGDTENDEKTLKKRVEILETM